MEIKQTSITAVHEAYAVDGQSRRHELRYTTVDGTLQSVIDTVSRESPAGGAAAREAVGDLMWNPSEGYAIGRFAYDGGFATAMSAFKEIVAALGGK